MSSHGPVSMNGIYLSSAYAKSHVRLEDGFPLIVANIHKPLWTYLQQNEEAS